MAPAWGRVLLGFLLLGGACGLKGPPRPPLPEAPDGGAPRTSYAPEAPVIEAMACGDDGGRASCGETVVLRFVAAGRPSAARLLLEEHVVHAGEEGPRCGARRIVAVVSARGTLVIRVPRRAAGAAYRLVDEGGVAWSPSVAIP